MLKLVKPDIKYKNQYLEMLGEWKGTGEQPQPWVLHEDYSDFNAMVQKFENLSKGIDVPNGFVPSSTYWAYDDESGKIVCAVNIRHYLNDMLIKVWGNIGYGIRPSERRKGYATIILKLALECCKTLKMERVLLGCYKENIASAKTILKNGGVLENEVIEENSGKLVQRYWINTKSILDE
uniref:GNAT family N-acetyltransferase n=1 Tax=Acetivibrio cellulolyticus TaxID=35830 RepID=UPI0019675F44|nr:GNAT family N-acetyltransferase [Acetivibrio cellulolyticus]